LSRIEEVLRRASRENLAAPEAAGRPSDESRESAWDFSDTSDPHAARRLESVFAEPSPPPFPEPARPVFAEPASPDPFQEPIRSAPAGVAGERPLVAPAAIERSPAPQPADVLITRTLRFDAIEQYRKLGAALHEAQLERGIRTILCTSALMGEGKTVTASNLALTLSESYRRRVLLIDADLRRPQIHAMFGIPNLTGLRDALSATEDTKLAIQQVTPHLSIVTAGATSSDPMSGLASPRLREVIEEARNKFDWVIVDTPPVLILPDARVLVSTVDAVLFVIRANTTPFRTVMKAVDIIKRERIFGTVLNSVEESALGAEYGGYEGYYAAIRPA
jgi:protein-tyrosine kinase